jgi:hypothetical protein
MTDMKKIKSLAIANTFAFLIQLVVSWLVQLRLINSKTWARSPMNIRRCLRLRGNLFPNLPESGRRIRRNLMA